MEREDPRNADRPAGNILAPSYLPALSCRISAAQHTAKLSFPVPFRPLPRRGLFHGVSRRSLASSTLEHRRKLLHSKAGDNEIVLPISLRLNDRRSSPTRIMNRQILVIVMPMDGFLAGGTCLDGWGLTIFGDSKRTRLLEHLK